MKKLEAIKKEEIILKNLKQLIESLNYCFKTKNFEGMESCAGGIVNIIKRM